MNKLAQALSIFIDPDELTEELVNVLICACEAGTISYEKLEKLAGDSSDDVLLLCWQWKLLIPVRTSQSGEWDHRIMSPKSGELYEIPNISLKILEHARGTGEWDSKKAIIDFFKSHGVPAWEKMPDLIKKIRQLSLNYVISADQIKNVCQDLELEEEVDSLIATLKWAGVMSPKLGSIIQVDRAGTPLYELNSSLFAEAVTCLKVSDN